MYHGGRKPTLHMIDGVPMTVDEIADMLGLTKRALVIRRQRMGGAAVSYQLVVDLYRQGRFQTRHDRWPRHLVNGEWITAQDAARRVGVQPLTLTRYMKANGVTLAEAVDHYRKYHTSENSLRLYIVKHQCSLQTAVRQLEERRKRQAEKDIMKILGF